MINLFFFVVIESLSRRFRGGPRALALAELLHSACKVARGDYVSFDGMAFV